MSSVARCACFHDVFIAYCFASSRENTMIRLGIPSSPRSRRRTKVCPSEPVPPVIRTTASSNGLGIRFLSVFVEHGVPARDGDPGLAPESRGVEHAVDARLVDTRDGAVDAERVAQRDEQVVL